MRYGAIRLFDNKFVMAGFSLFFLLSLCVHSHALDGDLSYKYETQPASADRAVSHSTELCSACRADGKVNLLGLICLSIPLLEISVVSDDNNYYIPNHVNLLKDPRAPPSVS